MFVELGCLRLGDDRVQRACGGDSHHLLTKLLRRAEGVEKHSIRFTILQFVTLYKVPLYENEVVETTQ